MARKFKEFEFEVEEFDADDYGRGRKFNKNERREARRSRETSRYASYNDTTVNDDQREYAY
jgi:hypothetical protein